jgi:hypothetical protein
LPRTPLKPGGSLFCMTGQAHLPKVMAALGKHLKYNWTVAHKMHANTTVWPRGVYAAWKPFLHYIKGDKYTGPMFHDVIEDTGPDDKQYHEWGQAEDGFLKLMSPLVRPGQVVLDPFLGGGTTGVAALKLGARFIGVDIAARHIQTSKVRLHERHLELEAERGMSTTREAA